MVLLSQSASKTNQQEGAAMTDKFVTEIDGQKLTRTTSREIVAAVLVMDYNGKWSIFSCHETWRAAEKGERKAISWMERNVSCKGVAISGLYKEQ